MPDTAVEPESASFVRVTGEDQAPACFRADWLPDLDVIPELTQLRDEHLRLLAAWDAAHAERNEITLRIEADKERREKALRDAYLAGQSPAHEDADPELKKEHERADQRCKAAASAFTEHINHCIATIIELQPLWAQAVEARNAAKAQEIADLQQRLAEAKGMGDAFKRLTYWLHRTAVEAAELPMVHYQYGALAYPLPSDADARAAAELRTTMRSYAGSPGGATLISDEESERIEQEALTAGQPEPVMEEAEA